MQEPPPRAIEREDLRTSASPTSPSSAARSTDREGVSRRCGKLTSRNGTASSVCGRPSHHSTATA